MFVFIRHITLAVMLFPVSAAFALDGERPAFVPPPAAIDSGSIVQIIVSLLLVLAAIVAVAWLLRRMNLAQQGAGNLLKVIGSVAIGQRERVVLIEVNDTWLLVGIGPGQIRTLHTLAREEGLLAASTPAPDNKFAQLLSSIIKPRSTDEKSDAP